MMPFFMIDDLFVRPFITGLMAAMLLPLLGVLLHLRREWLAALGIAHVSVAAQLLAHSLAFGFLTGILLASSLCLVVRLLVNRQGNVGYGLMIVLGWSSIYVFAANTALAEQLMHAISDGQLLLVNQTQTRLMATALVLFLLMLPILTPHLIRHMLIPYLLPLNARRVWPLNLSFYAISAFIITIAVSCIGIMATFALLFVTPLISVRLSSSFKQCLCFAPLIGVFNYLVVMVFALNFDQPIGGVLTLMLLGVLASVSALAKFKIFLTKTAVNL